LLIGVALPKNAIPKNSNREPLTQEVAAGGLFFISLLSGVLLDKERVIHFAGTAGA
jgi:hypothetical protein